MKFVSIIITHFASNAERSEQFRKSLESLVNTVKTPYELIVVDNGGSQEDSRYLLELNEKGIINTYIRNSNNMHFGYARNQALRICNGDYICIADNDILYSNGWLDSCLAVLDQNPNEKIYATPVYNVTHWRLKYFKGEIKANDKVYRLNMRAGSNCWVMRREDFKKVGSFLIHRIAGTKWTDNAVHLGYLAAVTPELMIKDMGFRRGYNLKESLPVKLNLHNGEEVYFNVDEFKNNPDNINKTYIKQEIFND